MRTPSVIRDTVCAVVGGAGFLGSHLVDHLIEDRHCKVIVIDNLCAGRKSFIHSKAILIKRDITGPEEELLVSFKRYGVKFVFSYAASPYVPDCYSHPLRTFNINAMGAMKVINAAQEAGCEAILQVSSAEMYKESGDVGLTEESTIEPHSSYGASKAAVDYYCQCAWRERQTPVISLRQFNCCGERDCLHPYVIPAIVEQIVSPTYKGTIRLGNNTRRDFLYARDAVELATELLEVGEFGEVFNLGSEEFIHIYDLAQEIADVLNCGRVTILEDESRKRPYEIWSLLSNNSKLYRTIKGRPKVGFKEALRRTVNWLVENR